MNIAIIGAAIVDVLACPISEQLFKDGSASMEGIKISFGGDALNEAVGLSRFGKRVQLISKVGDDEAGRMVLEFCRRNKISTGSIGIEPGLATGVNIVLTDTHGERYFLTDPHGSLRTLGPEDIEGHLDGLSGIVSFASLFVSERMGTRETTEVFRRIKANAGTKLCVDMTRTKHGESLEDIRPMLGYVDYIFPNESEIRRLTGTEDTVENAGRLLEYGVQCAVIKQGSRGCYIRTAEEELQIPAYPGVKCVDTTGAGDTFAAGFIWALSEGYGLEECGRFACAAASLAVEVLGATDGIGSVGQVMERYRRMQV